MTKKQTGVNDQNAATNEGEQQTAGAETTTEATTAEGDEPEDVANGEDDMNESLEPEAEPTEEVDDGEPALHPEAKKALEAEYPVLREHGSHNAAVNGLQTSPGYDPSKL